MNRNELESARWATGHEPVIGFRINRSVPRPSLDELVAFDKLFVPDISDAVGQLYTMDAGIRPLYTGMPRILGFALTVKLAPGDNSMSKRAMQMARDGDVLVIDARGHTDTCAGGAGALLPAISRGLRGVVVDGAWRDVTELKGMAFPVAGRGVSPYSGPKRRLGEINVPVQCGGVIVHPGDLVMVDDEGGVVVPRQYIGRVREALSPYENKAATNEENQSRASRLEMDRDSWFDQYFLAHGGEYDQDGND